MDLGPYSASFVSFISYTSQTSIIANAYSCIFQSYNYVRIKFSLPSYYKQTNILLISSTVLFAQMKTTQHPHIQYNG